MPSTSPKQAKTMRAAKHDPEFARRMGIPQKVAAEFVAADKKKKRLSVRGEVKKAMKKHG